MTQSKQGPKDLFAAPWLATPSRTGHVDCPEAAVAVAQFSFFVAGQLCDLVYERPLENLAKDGIDFTQNGSRRIAALIALKNNAGQ
jgi:hypothetical protein